MDQLCRDELAVALTRCQTLEASRDEMKGRLDEFINVFNVSPDEVHVTDQKLGSGAFAGKDLAINILNIKICHT